MQPSPLLLTEQGPALRTMLRIAVRSALQGATGRRANPAEFPPIECTVPAPSSRLVRSYAAWAGAPADKYTDHLPPHLFTQYALPVCARQLERTRYRLAGTINQGCRVEVLGRLPRRQRLRIVCELRGIEEDDARANVHLRATVAPATGDPALAVDLHVVFVTGTARRGPRVAERAQDLVSIGRFDALSRAGLEFGILTGDLNPIHWLAPVARLSPFRGKVLHGFGTFVRTFELIEQHDGRPLDAIDVRFVRPLRLPSRGNVVLVGPPAAGEAHRPLQLRDRNGKILLAGHCR